MDQVISNKIVEEITSIIRSEKITLNKAKEMVAKAENKAVALNVSVVIAIVDEGGNLVLQHRMDEAPIASISIAFSKAYTSLALKQPTEDLAKWVGPNQSLYGLESLCNGKLCVFGGGIPIANNGKVIGGIGVSGGTVEEDILIAESALVS
jgi:uncharacterized protein GlcG (DUF336 family)